MSLIPRVYQSTDAGAPALTGQVGSMRDLLRAILVTGYSTGGTAKVAAGWTEPYIGTNVSVFRNDPVLGTGRYLRVDDGATVAGSNARYALLRAYEAMTDVNTGTGPSPTVAQVENGIVVPKSLTLSSTARAWFAIANERWCYLFVDTGNTGAGWVGVASMPLFFGDLVSRRAGDMYHFAVVGSNLTSFTSSVVSTGMFVGAVFSNAPAGNVYLLRNYLQTPGSKAASVAALSDGYVAGCLGAAGNYPDVVSGGLKIERISIFEGAGQVRGQLPNVYGTTDGRPFSDLSVRSDIQGVPPNTQILAKIYSQVAGSPENLPQYSGQLFFDLTNAWGPG